MVDASEKPIESAVRFLNVDVDVFGAINLSALRNGFGEAIVVLREGGHAPDEPALSFELSTVNPTLAGAMTELISL